MADSNITKKALAQALKELMQEEPFGKISVSEICQMCDMNRKSFYYHFRDKYDLVNWIFSSEFESMVRSKEYGDIWGVFDDLCVYLYENRDFYCRALKIKGQNSFSEFFREQCLPFFTKKLGEVLASEETTEFQVNFYADAFICAIERWITKNDSMGLQEFSKNLRSCIAKPSDIK